LGAAALMNEHFTTNQLVRTSHPYSQSSLLLLGYEDLISEVGTVVVVADTGQSSVHWSFPNAGSADIHLRLRGAKGQVFSNLLWSRIAGHWQLLSAHWVDNKGVKHDIPLGPNGRFLSQTELRRYHQADPTTPLGRGERALLHGQYRRAVIEYEQALQTDPTAVLALAGLGLTFLQIGEHHRAQQLLETALSLDPSHVHANGALLQLQAVDQSTASKNDP
jgi:hypothetical protein